MLGLSGERTGFTQQFGADVVHRAQKTRRDDNLVFDRASGRLCFSMRLTPVFFVPLRAQMLFKAEGLAASSSDRIQKLRLLEETVKSKRSRKLECKRAEQAKQKLLERSAGLSGCRMCSIWAAPIRRVDNCGICPRRLSFTNCHPVFAPRQPTKKTTSLQPREGSHIVLVRVLHSLFFLFRSSSTPEV